MKNKLHHPLWTHIPALALLVFFIVRLATAGPIPAQAPIHFSWGGEPDNFGSPWISIGLTLGLSLLYICVSAVLDEVWARYERKKNFNWLSLFDEIIVGFLVGINLGYLDFLQPNNATFTFPVLYVATLTAGAAIAAVVLELARPFNPLSVQPVVEDATRIAAEIANKMKGKIPFLYWESQNPFYFNLLSIILPVVMTAAAIFVWVNSTWVSALFFILGILFFLLYGGMRTVVVPGEVAVRFGLTGLKVLKLKTTEIASSEVTQFAPIGDFGGYGIRFNGKMIAYYLKGNRGVKITTRKGKQYLIGSDHPEQLLAVIMAVTGTESVKA